MRCVHGSWQGTYCPDCGGNRAVFGRQRHVPDLTKPAFDKPCGAVLTCARSEHPGDARHERAYGISWHWHETALPHGARYTRLLEAAQGMLHPLKHRSHQRPWSLSEDCDTCNDLHRSRYGALRAALEEVNVSNE